MSGFEQEKQARNSMIRIQLKPVLRLSFRSAVVACLLAGVGFTNHFGSLDAFAQTKVAAQKATIPPHKDDYFAYKTILSQGDQGDYLIIDYNELRDINGRDAIVEKRVKDAYVSHAPRKFQKDLQIQTTAGPIRTIAVGEINAATRFVVIYLHGRGGNRHQGSNDFSFGGNFNRLKNLALKGGGVYLSPDFTDFSTRGTTEIAGLIEAARKQAPQAKVIIACGSAGGQLCWELSKDAKASAIVDGLVLLGSLWDASFLKTDVYSRRVPVFFAHGSRDPVFAIESQQSFYQLLRKTSSGYPVKFHRFESGNHGTPIRMIDWRLALNWVLAQTTR